MNIGIIIKNNYGDTFPVALTPQMVGVIQNLLTQIPLMKSGGIVGADGKAVAAKASIPIIPRKIPFNWDTAYEPIPPGTEQVLLNTLVSEYAKIDTEADLKEVETDLTPDDPDGKIIPLKLECKAEGRANVGLEDKAVERQDATVTPGPLDMGAGTESPGKDQE